MNENEIRRTTLGDRKVEHCHRPLHVSPLATSESIHTRIHTVTYLIYYISLNNLKRIS